MYWSFFSLVCVSFLVILLPPLFCYCLFPHSYYFYLGHGIEVDLRERDYGSKEFDQYLLINTSSTSKHTNRYLLFWMWKRRRQRKIKGEKVRILSWKRCFGSICTEFEVKMILKNERFFPYMYIYAFSGEK